MKTRKQQNLIAALADQGLRRRLVPCPFGFEWPVSVHVTAVTYITQGNGILNKSDDGYRKRRKLVS